MPEKDLEEFQEEQNQMMEEEKSHSYSHLPSNELFFYFDDEPEGE